MYLFSRFKSLLFNKTYQEKKINLINIIITLNTCIYIKSLNVLGYFTRLIWYYGCVISACPWSDLNAETDQKIYYWLSFFQVTYITYIFSVKGLTEFESRPNACIKTPQLSTPLSINLFGWRSKSLIFLILAVWEFELRMQELWLFKLIHFFLITERNIVIWFTHP